MQVMKDLLKVILINYLNKLKDKPDRTARFRTIICLTINGKHNIFEGNAKELLLQKGVAVVDLDMILYLFRMVQQRHLQKCR